MATIKIQDLPQDMQLDRKILSRIAGGTTFRVEGSGEKATVIRRKSKSPSTYYIETFYGTYPMSSSNLDTDGDGWVSWEEYQAAEK